MTASGEFIPATAAMRLGTDGIVGFEPLVCSHATTGRPEPFPTPPPAPLPRKCT